MVSSATILCVCISLVISLVLPVILLILYAAKHKKQGILSAWILGAAGFFVTQILIRLPILTALQSKTWFLDFSRNHLFSYAFSLAFTAGLFELAGRVLVAKLMQKNLTYSRSLAAGLGHGGIESMILIGITYVNNLVYIALINSGSFDAVIAQTAAAGIDVTQLEMIRTQLLTTSPALFLLAGYERILTMVCHAAMSMIVCYGVFRKNLLPCMLLCLGIHTLMDLSAGISLAMSQSIAYPIIYCILSTVAVCALVIIRYIHHRWDKEVSHDPEK